MREKSSLTTNIGFDTKTIDLNQSDSSTVVNQKVEEITDECSTQSPESIASTYCSANIEEMDSEILDLTPIQEMLSSDPSTAVETTTVVERVVTTKPKVPPKPIFLCGSEPIKREVTAIKNTIKDSENINTFDKESVPEDITNIEEGVKDFKNMITQRLLNIKSKVNDSEVIQVEDEEEDDEAVSDEPSGGALPFRRSLSGELSTVSEVSEEISTNGVGLHAIISSFEKDLPQMMDKELGSELTQSVDGFSSGNVSNHSGATTPSLAESTTSGSFIIEMSGAEPTSIAESDATTSGKSPNQTCLPTHVLNNVKPMTSEIIETKQMNQKENHIQELENKESIKVSDSSLSSTQPQINQKKSEPSEEELISNKEKFEKKTKKRIKTQNESQTILLREMFYSMRRRARSLNRSPEKVLKHENQSSGYHQTCSHQHFSHSWGEQTKKPSVPLIRRRSTFDTIDNQRIENSIPNLFNDDEEEDAGIHIDSYRTALWLYIGCREEMSVWGHKNSLNGRDIQKPLQRSESNESTLSEKCFRRHYEAITHRLIHRKASIEMYKRILNRTFVIEKVLTLIRNNGEFGFRIHGSRPVVIYAIEKGMPAEVSGLEVGDIIVSVNDTNVLEASHSEVVKLAHTGSETLKLEVIGTAKPIKKNPPTFDHYILMNGYLSRLTDKVVDKQKEDTTHGTKKIWRRRWFVLKSDFCLYWYKNPKCTEPVGAISLHGYCAGVSNETIFGQSFVFRLVRYATPQKYFAASDAETAGQWVNALNQSATRINQIDPYIDLTLYNIHKSPLSIKYLDCYGYLGKFSRRRKVWKQRYFVLKDACLYFYSDANSNKALGVFYLHGYKVQSRSMVSIKHTFEVIPPDPKFKHLWLLSESDADKKRWLSALEYSIDRWIRLK